MDLAQVTKLLDAGFTAAEIREMMQGTQPEPQPETQPEPETKPEPEPQPEAEPAPTAEELLTEIRDLLKDKN